MLENFETIFYDHSLLFERKMTETKELLKGKTKQKRLIWLLSFYNLAYEKTRTLLTDEVAIKSLRSTKSRQTRAWHALTLQEDDIDFKVLDKLLRQHD